MSAGWRDRAACNGHDPELWFADGEHPEATAAAIAVCHTCPVMQQCRAHAIAAPEWYGVWGGLSKGELGKAIRAAGTRKPRHNARADKQAERAPARKAAAEKAAAKRAAAEERAAAAGLDICQCRRRAVCQLTVDDDRHGKRVGYRLGCGCNACTDAEIAAYARFREAARRRTPPDHVHGTADGLRYWGCTCTVCLSGEAERERERSARRTAEPTRR